MSIAIGIDLETTNSCVAWYSDDRVQIIENEDEETITPSFVYYDNDETIVGKSAKNRCAINPSSGIFDSKRMLGRKFDDKEIQSNLPKWPFEVTKAENGEPQIKIQRKRKVLNLRPEEVSAEILKHLKKSACAALKSNITKAVITVPAYFSNSQRQATQDAAKIAGLNVLKLINEPTAAALAFIEPNNETRDRTVLVYDLGGGTFDVSLIKFHLKNNWKGEVVSIFGDTNLGGRDFDNNLFSYFLDEIEGTYNLNIRSDTSKNSTRNYRRISTSCCNIKKSLSASNRATLVLDQFQGHDVKITVLRDQFEKLNERLFERTIQIVDEVLTNANITGDEVDDVVLVGGSTRIPKIQQMVCDYFGGKNLNKSVNPDEAVARGAAIQAALLSDDLVQKIGNYSLTDVTPLSLGIGILGKVVDVIIRRNTKIPVSVEQHYFTSFDYQTMVRISIYEGESRHILGNVFLGQFDIRNITSRRKGQVQINVRFEIDSNGILHVRATESSKNMSRDLNIVLHNGGLSA